MYLKTIGILMPGDMGHGCGKIFVDNNFRVISCLNKRSDRTKKLSKLYKSLMSGQKNYVKKMVQQNIKIPSK